jgi:6-phosphogluconolactonase (cycloisomerase 2 family)
MKASTLLPLALACSTASADTLFVGTYAGTIESLRFDPDTGALSRLSCTNASAPGPSWQELSANKKFLYTVEETSPIDASRGAVTSYSIGPDAKLTRVASALGMASPVSLALSPDQKLIFTAN